MRLSTKLVLAIAIAARLFVASSANAEEHAADATAFAYMAVYVTYDASGDAEIDVADSGLSQQDCARWLATAPAPERYSDGALTAAECMLGEGD